MSLIILLFSLGLLLLAIEVFIPGGILGIAGGILLFAGCAVSFIRLGNIEGLIAIGAAVLAALVLFYLQFKIFPNTRAGKKFFLNRVISASAGNLAPSARDLIGKTAISTTVLSPSGYVIIDGTRYEAFSQSGQIAKDTELIVTAANSFQLSVRLKS